MLRIILLLSVVAAATCQRACSRDNDCPFGQVCSSGLFRTCFNRPQFLGERCGTTSHCETYVDLWSECRWNQCKCKSSFYTVGYSCSLTPGPGNIALIVLVYTLIPIVIFAIIIWFTVRFVRRRQMITTMMVQHSPSQQTYNTMSYSQGAYRPPPVQGFNPNFAAPPPPSYSNATTYSQSQGVTKY